MLIQKEPQQTHIAGMVGVDGQPHLEGLEYQGFVVNPHADSQPAVIAPPEDRLSCTGDDPQIPEGEKGHIETVKIPFLEINGLHVKAKTLLPENLAALESSDQIGLFKSQLLLFKAVDSRFIVNVDELTEAGTSRREEPGDKTGTEFNHSLSHFPSFQVSADTSRKVEVSGFSPREVAMGKEQMGIVTGSCFRLVITHDHLMSETAGNIFSDPITVNQFVGLVTSF